MNATLGIAIAMVLILTVIVMLFAMQAKKHAKHRKNKLLAAIEALAGKHHLDIEYQDTLHNRIIGVDIKKKVLVFADWKNENVHTEVIAVKDVKDCTLIKRGNKIIEKTKSCKKTTDEYVYEIQMELILPDGPIYLTMYNEMIDGVLEKQLLTDVATKWREHVMKLMD